MSLSFIRGLIPGIFLAMAPPFAFAQGGPPDGFQLGVVGIAATNPYVGEDTDVIAYPAISYRSGAFEIGTLGVAYGLPVTAPLSVTLAVRPRFSGLFSTDAPELDGIDREITGDLALETRYDFGAFHGDLHLRQEVTAEHEGQEVILSVGRRERFGPALVNFRAGAAWQSGDLSGYIWGVSEQEARAGRDAYNPGTVIIPFAGVRGIMPISRNWTMIGSLRADFLPGEVRDSPIVDSDDIISSSLGLTYRF